MTAETELAEVLRRFSSNRDTDDSSLENDRLVKMSGAAWHVVFRGQRCLAPTLADVPRIFREMGGDAA